MSARRPKNRGRSSAISVTDCDIFFMAALDNLYLYFFDYFTRVRVQPSMERYAPRLIYLPSSNVRRRRRFPPNRNDQDGLLPTPIPSARIGQVQSYDISLMEQPPTNIQPAQLSLPEPMQPCVNTDPSEISASEILVHPPNPSFKVLLHRPYSFPQNGQPVQPTVSYMSSTDSYEMLMAQDPRIFPAFSRPLPGINFVHPLQALPIPMEQNTDFAGQVRPPGLSPNCRFVNGEMVFYDGEYIKHAPAQLPEELKQPLEGPCQRPLWVEKPKDWEESSCFYTPNSSKTSSDRTENIDGMASSASAMLPIITISQETVESRNSEKNKSAATNEIMNMQETRFDQGAFSAVLDSHTILKQAAEAAKKGSDLLENIFTSLVEYEQMVEEFKTCCEIDPCNCYKD